MSSARKISVVGFLIGVAAGSIIALLYAPKSGKELRGDIRNGSSDLLKRAAQRRDEIISKAKAVANTINEKGEQIIITTKKFADGKFPGTVEAIEKEISNLKYAMNTAVTAYRKGALFKRSIEEEVDDLFIDFEHEVLPKFEGMGRRK
jgi:gas vesicle protein